MRCPQCGASNDEVARFCHVCGAFLPQKDQAGLASGSSQARVNCPYCGASNPQVAKFCSTCGQLLPMLPGNIFASRYRIERLLGQGGMGRTYLVYDFQADEQRVLKEMISDANASTQEREAYESYFHNEAEVQARLRALRAVPTLLEPEQEHDGRRFFVMEYVPGDDLATALRKRGRPFTPERVVNWALELCDLLDYLHAYRPGVSIIHRDISPDNIKLRDSDPDSSDIALLDFGLARLAPQGHHLTQGLGKPGYAAPEQLRGRTEPRSDLYSLAATMHFLLSGRDPNANPPPFPAARELNPRVPQWLSDLIALNLQEDPNQRSLSAAALREELERGRGG
jgi:serine/threonine protein kinase